MTAAHWSDTATLDPLFMTAADGDATAVKALADSLAAAAPQLCSDWPQDVRDAWEAGIDLALDALDRSALEHAHISFLRHAAAAGFEGYALRDGLAAAIRVTLGNRFDPAVLLATLGVHKTEVPTALIARRLTVLEAMLPDAACYDPRHGVGTVAAVDDLTGELRVLFKRRVTLPLTLAIDTLVFVRSGSLLQRLRNGQEQWSAHSSTARDELQAVLTEGCVCLGDVPDEALHDFLVPAVISDEQYAEAFADTDDSESRQEDRSTQRRWDEARAIAELVDILTRSRRIPLPPLDCENLHRIFASAKDRDDQRQQVAEAVARLWRAAPEAPWLVILLDTVQDAACWGSVEAFAGISDDMAGALTLPWFQATARAQSPRYLASATLALPLRLWGYVEKVFDGRADIDPRLLLETVVTAMHDGDVSADVLVWLWKRDVPERRLLANPQLLFRTLEQPVKGPYLRARKELYKLLMESPDFQRLIMKNGDPQAVETLVRSVKHVSLLDAGERQSLLVKIVRIFPEAISLVEEKPRRPARKRVGNITSVRSYEERARELREIINERIPANSRAIAHARGYGDLRENAEFKAAKEEQAYLGARRVELEEGLHDVRPTDFGDVVVDNVVVPGCTVQLKTDDGGTVRHHVLGLWDSDPERSIISYDTPLGQLLMGKRPGEIVELPTGQQAEVSAIEPLEPDLLQWTAGTGTDE